ncbi:MAG: right-handed parallel beta-helix repeat-containing protein [Kofleriaceae bacterium]
MSELLGNAVLAATDVATQDLGMSVNSTDQSSATLSHATLIGDRRCLFDLISIQSSKMLTLTDSNLDGGGQGVGVISSGSPAQVSLSNVVIRNMGGNAIGGSNATVQVTGGELSHSFVGVFVAGGSWSLTNVAIEGNTADGVYVEQRGAGSIALAMHGCSVRGNNHGVYLATSATADLGTTMTPGNNVFQSNRGLGLVIDPSDGQTQIDAVGNTWQPGIQGADDLGTYAPTSAFGPVAHVRGNNYAIRSPMWSLTL